MNQLVRTSSRPWTAHTARSGRPQACCHACPLRRATSRRTRPQVPLIHAASDVSNAPVEVAEPAPAPEPEATLEWGEAYELDWAGQPCDTHASEPEDLGFAALCSVILLLGVGIFSMTRPATRPAAAQYVTRQPNITLIIEKDTNNDNSKDETDSQSAVGAAQQDASARSRLALTEDSQDFVHTVDDIRPAPDMHASLEQQLGPSGAPAFSPPAPRPHHSSPFTDSEDPSLATTSQPAPPQPYPLPDPSTSYTAFPDEPYPGSPSQPYSGAPTPSIFQQLHLEAQPPESNTDDPAPPPYLTNPSPPPDSTSTPPSTSYHDPPSQPSPATASTSLPGSSTLASIDPPTTTPQLPQLQAEQPSHAVEPSELQELSPDPSLQNMRERVQIAMRASAAASEASHRASAYSAAASSAASKAADAAERAMVATTALQRALEDISEEAISGAEARVARALELAGDAEGRAASAAALATAYQDIAQTQASVAEQVSSVVSKTSTSVPGGGVEAAAAATKSSQLPFLQGLQGQWRLARFQLQQAVEQLGQGCNAAATAAGRFIAVAIIKPLLGLWAWLVSQF